MKKVVSLVLLAAVLFAGPAFAADPVIGTWKLNVAKSKFIPGAALTAGTRVYTEVDGLYTVEQKFTGADANTWDLISRRMARRLTTSIVSYQPMARR